MTEILQDAIGWRGLLSTVVAFGFLPGLILRVIVRLFPKDDPRRRELQAEVYVVPWWERPLWVAQQLEVALVEGCSARFHSVQDLAARAAIARVFRSAAIRESLLEQIQEVSRTERLRWALAECVSGWRQTWSLGSGVKTNAEWPDTFEIPDADAKRLVRLGDAVKLMFETSDGWCERMWVEVTRRRRGRFVGEMRCIPVGITRLGYGDRVNFTAEHIIDIDFAELGPPRRRPPSRTPDHPQRARQLTASAQIDISSGVRGVAVHNEQNTLGRRWVPGTSARRRASDVWGPGRSSHPVGQSSAWADSWHH